MNDSTKKGFVRSFVGHTHTAFTELGWFFRRVIESGQLAQLWGQILGQNSLSPEFPFWPPACTQYTTEA